MTAAMQQTRRLTYHPRRPGRIWRVLATIANHPAGITSAQVADSMMPAARPRYRAETAARRALRERLGINAGECPEARQKLRRRLRGQVSRDIRKLSGLGYISSAIGPRLDPVELAIYREHGWEPFRRLRYLVDSDGHIIGRQIEPDTAEGRFRRDIVQALAENPDGMSTDDLMRATGGYTPSGREYGAWRAAMSGLEGSGTVIPGRARFVTPAGLAMLEVR